MARLLTGFGTRAPVSMHAMPGTCSNLRDSFSHNSSPKKRGTDHKAPLYHYTRQCAMSLANWGSGPSRVSLQHTANAKQPLAGVYAWNRKWIFTITLQLRTWIPRIRNYWFMSTQRVSPEACNWELLRRGGSYFGALHVGSYHFRSILGAPDFLKCPCLAS